MSVDPNEAPVGFVAKASETPSSCVGCAFLVAGDCSVRIPLCYQEVREDGMDVVFVAKPMTYRTDRIGD